MLLPPVHDVTEMRVGIREPGSQPVSQALCPDDLLCMGLRKTPIVRNIHLEALVSVARAAAFYRQNRIKLDNLIPGTGVFPILPILCKCDLKKAD